MVDGMVKVAMIGKAMGVRIMNGKHGIAGKTAMMGRKGGMMGGKSHGHVATGQDGAAAGRTAMMKAGAGIGKAGSPVEMNGKAGSTAHGMRM